MRRMPTPRVVTRLCRRVAILALLGVAGLAAFAPPAHAQTDVIRGRVLTVEGLPLQNVRVTATSIPGNVTREARTNRDGGYQIAFANGPHDYIMGFSLIGYAFKQFEIKQVADEDVLIADARLSVVQLDTVVSTASNQQRVSRNSQTPDVSGTEQTVNNTNLPPELQGDLAAMAASLPGVTLIPGLDGQADGFSVLGLGADQNTTTMNGMSFNSGNLPRDAQVQSSLSTSTLDVSRGGFSGANFNLSAASGSNFRTRGTSFVFNAPALEWTDRAAQAVGTEYTNLSLGGVISGPITYNQAFFSLSYQLGRNSRDNATLLNTNALGLLTAGVAYDSVQNLLGILRQRGLNPTVGGLHQTRLSDNGSVFGNVSFSPPQSTTGQTFGLTYNANWSRQDPAGGGATSLASASGDRTNWGGGLQARHTAYIGNTLSETQLSGSLSRNYGTPFLVLPAGNVRVSSDLPDGASGVSNLVFGGGQAFGSTSQSRSAGVQNTLSWFDNANKHRLKLETEINYNGSAVNQSFNRLGTFSFNSLSDLANGVPASFTRSLSAYDRSINLLLAGASIGDSYRRNQDLQIQYGVRIDGAHYLTSPTYNADVDHLFGLRNDHVPNPISVSPRIGFQKTLGQAPEIFAFTGAQRAPRAILRASVGVFTNNPSVGLISSALDNNGLPTGAQQISCVGPAAPIPNWAGYETDPASIPTTCADGTLGTPFATSAPNVYLISPDYHTPRSVRANASWNGSLFDGRFAAGINGTYSLNVDQQRSFDLNFKPAQQFSLDDGRPVFAQAANIVPTTGSIAPGDAHVTTSYTHVYETRSDLKSHTSQIQVSLSPIPHGPTKFTWSTTYTYLHTRELVSGFQNTAGNPLDLLWSTNGQGPHQISYSLRYNLFNAAAISWNGSFRSGNKFTPMIAGDVNGDGYSNDRAFVYNPASLGAGDSALASGMRQLLDNSTGATRDCLEKQIGHIATRNSCQAPWSSNANISVSLDRAKFRMPQRANVSFSLNNPLGAADLALNGSGHLKGWGQSYAPDQSLLYVRGFDPSTKRFTYEVNQRFGATSPALVVLRSPVVFTTQVRVDVGAMRERQTLGMQLGVGRVLPGTRAPEALFRAIGVSSISNPMGTIIRQQDSLHLTVVQADSLAAMNRRYTYRCDSLWAPIARYFVQLPERYDEGEAYDRYLRTRRAQIDMLSQLAPTIRALLTPEQLRKVPQLTLNTLDPLYLASVRDGTSLYVGGIAPFFGAPIFIGGGGYEMAAVAFTRF
ncbi:MAG TPA: TonB-dependent receptor [Gemmatimonadaceae bacterium]|nr:TonB-dependent receptor [Gemmatimonadaceae bacterium]